MPHAEIRRVRLATALPTGLAALLALGWAAREAAFARDRAAPVGSVVVRLDQVKMEEYRDDGQVVGSAGAYVAGDTPGSTQFITGRFVLGPGKSPHPPHAHAEEEVMIVESGEGDILVDGKATRVGPGSVMYTTPNTSHGIVNTGDRPIVFYFIKWTGRRPG